MPREKNTLLRVVVPLLLVLGGIGVAASVFFTSAPSQPASQTTPAQATTPTQTPAPTTPAPTTPAPTTPAPTTPATPTSQPEAPQPAPAQPAQAQPAQAQPAQAQPATPASTTIPRTLRALAYPTQAGLPIPGLGSISTASTEQVEIQFAQVGAGLQAVRLADNFESIKRDAHVMLQAPALVAGQTIVPFAALAIEVTPPAPAGGTPTPQVVPLFGTPSDPVWRTSPDRPGFFEATIVDETNTPVLRITREFVLRGVVHGWEIRQRIENLSGVPLSVRWYQYGPVDLPGELGGYGGDKRRFRAGYLLSPQSDPSQSVVVSDDHVIAHDTLVGKRDKVTGWYPEKPVWPNETSRTSGHQLVWSSLTSRYFAVAMHPLTGLNATGADKTFRWVGGITRLALPLDAQRGLAALRLESVPLALAPAGLAGSAADVSMGVFSGPLDTKDINADALRGSLGMAGLVLYNFGGMCGPCTFTWMTHLLLGLMRFLHDSIVFDWAIAIVLLVFIVRTVLHPVTRWSQIRMARFGKQMGAIAPKQKELQEKYKNDPKKMQAETARLWREEGINPAGMLGCIPMFLQTPVWIALYATLFFAVELRHEGAFYGIFQMLQPQASPFWRFLGDLSEPDRLWYFGKYYHVPLLSGLLGPIHSFNILPLILGVVFYIQQKYLSPPTTVQLSPEQELQQKMVKWMMVVMFPLFMYNAPSGLAIYFITNSVLGILESKWIRADAERKGLLDLDKMREAAAKRRAARGGEGFLERFQRLAEQQAQARSGGAGKGKPAGK